MFVVTSCVNVLNSFDVIYCILQKRFGSWCLLNFVTGRPNIYVKESTSTRIGTQNYRGFQRRGRFSVTAPLTLPAPVVLSESSVQDHEPARLENGTRIHGDEKKETKK